MLFISKEKTSNFLVHRTNKEATIIKRLAEMKQNKEGKVKIIVKHRSPLLLECRKLNTPKNNNHNYANKNLKDSRLKLAV